MFRAICQVKEWLVKRKNAVLLSGAIWGVIGVRLLYTGLHRVEDLSLMAIGLCLGYLKGRFALKKGALRVIKHLRFKEEPVRWTHIYSPAYWMLLIGMGGMGMLLRFIPGIPLELRGTINIIIGVALLQGATTYFKEAHALGS